MIDQRKSTLTVPCAGRLLCRKSDLSVMLIGHMQRINWIIKWTCLLIGATAVLAFGCGDDNDSSGSDISVKTGSLTKMQFIKRSDAICRKGRARFQDDFTEYVQRNEPKVSEGDLSASELEAKAAEIVDNVFIPNYDEQIEQIRSLGAPSGDEDKIVAILNAIQRAVDEAGNQPLEFLRSSGRPFQEAGRLARDYGLTACGERSGPRPDRSN